MINKIPENGLKIMGIKSKNEYVQFYLDLNMGSNVNLISFINNEKRVLKIKLQSKQISKEPILAGIEILENILNEIHEFGEQKVLEKYSKLKKE